MRSTGAAALLVAAAIPAGCGGGGTDDGSPALRALRSDPLGAYTPAGATLVRESATDAGQDALGKLRGTSLRRDFNLPASGAGRGAVAAAVRIAVRAGWSSAPTAAGIDGFALLRRTAGPGTWEATISAPRRSDALTGGLRWPALVVTLRAG